MIEPSRNQPNEFVRTKSLASASGRPRPAGPKAHSSRRESPRSTAYRLTRFAWQITYGCLRVASVGAIAFGLIAAFYLTLRQSPTTATISWLPASFHPVSVWMDRHGYLQNVPAYGLLALPFLVLCPTPRTRVVMIGALSLFAAVIEGLQFFIPTRDLDWEDIVLSWMGLLIAWSLSEAVRWAAKRVRRFLMIPR